MNKVPKKDQHRYRRKPKVRCVVYIFLILLIVVLRGLLWGQAK